MEEGVKRKLKGEYQKKGKGGIREDLTCRQPHWKKTRKKGKVSRRKHAGGDKRS